MRRVRIARESVDRHGVVFDWGATQTKTKPSLELLFKWQSPRGVEAILDSVERFNTELHWGVKHASWVFGKQNPIELVHEMPRNGSADPPADPDFAR